MVLQSFIVFLLALVIVALLYSLYRLKAGIKLIVEKKQEELHQQMNYSKSYQVKKSGYYVKSITG